jgi:uncharacterized membrane protein required for colicin V production
MSLFDIILLIIIAGFGLAGFFFGLIQTITSLLGSIVAIFVSFRFYAPVSEWILSKTSWDENLARVITFIVVFILINRLVVFIFWILSKAFSLVTNLPFIHSANQTLGFFFGIFEATVILGVVFYFIVRFPISDKFMDALAVSRVAPVTEKVASIFVPLIPEAIQRIKSVVEIFN